MSEENNNAVAAPAEAANGPAFTVEKIYVKDVSFESPNSPVIFNENVQPELQLNLNQKVQRLSETAFEVVLGVTLTCKAGDKTAYVAEVEQADAADLQPVGVDGHADRAASGGVVAVADGVGQGLAQGGRRIEGVVPPLEDVR